MKHHHIQISNFVWSIQKLINSFKKKKNSPIFDQEKTSGSNQEQEKNSSSFLSKWDPLSVPIS